MFKAQTAWDNKITAGAFCAAFTSMCDNTSSLLLHFQMCRITLTGQWTLIRYEYFESVTKQTLFRSFKVIHGVISGSKDHLQMSSEMDDTSHVEISFRFTFGCISINHIYNILIVMYDANNTSFQSGLLKINERNN